MGAASSLRSLDRLIDQTIEYTAQRQAFGKSILDNQVVHFGSPNCAPRSRRCAR